GRLLALGRDGGGRGRHRGGDGLLRVGVGGDAWRELQVADGDDVADLEVGDVDGDVGGDVVGLGGDGQGVQHLVDDALLAGDLLGLALEHDRDVDGDGHVDVDLHEVDVQHVPPDRVALELLDDGLRPAAVDVQREQGVEALVG